MEGTRTIPLLVPLLLVPFLLAQSPTFDAFEVATIKPAPSDLLGRYIRMQTAHQLEARNQSVRRLTPIPTGPTSAPPSSSNSASSSKPPAPPSTSSSSTA